MSVESGIVVSGVSFAYGRRTVLSELSLALRGGRLTALLGPNGAGKTTLIALLCGLVVAERGTITVLGHDMGRNPRAGLARMGIVFQQQTLDLDLSVLQNMRYFAALRGLAGRAADARIDTCLARMGLAGRAGEKARLLNGGHRRRLEIARALVHEPAVLILDEPTVGLDVPSRDALVRHVHALCAEDGITVLWATHLVDEVWDDDDLVVLHEGRVRAAGAVREVLAQTATAIVLDAFAALTGDADDAGPERGAAT